MANSPASKKGAWRALGLLTTATMLLPLPALAVAGPAPEIPGVDLRPTAERAWETLLEHSPETIPVDGLPPEGVGKALHEDPFGGSGINIWPAPLKPYRQTFILDLWKPDGAPKVFVFPRQSGLSCSKYRSDDSGATVSCKFNAPGARRCEQMRVHAIYMPDQNSAVTGASTCSEYGGGNGATTLAARCTTPTYLSLPHWSFGGLHPAQTYGGSCSDASPITTSDGGRWWNCDATPALPGGSFKVSCAVTVYFDP